MGGAAATGAPPAPPAVALDSIGQPIGPLTDPDTQVTDAHGVAPGLQDPGEKRNAPPHDLVRFPEKSEAQVAEEAEAEARAEVAQGAHESDEAHAGMTVTTEEPALGGKAIEVTIYEPVPGVTPAELVERLKASGKSSAKVTRDDHSRVPATSPNGPSPEAPSTGDEAGTAAFAGPDDCTNGNAVWWTCLPAYWTNNGYTDPIIRMNDHTSAAWKTADATSLWNAVPNIQFNYIWNSCPFMAGARCVDVWNANYGNTGWIGEFSYLLNASDTRKLYEPNSTYPQQVRLNDWYNPAGGAGYGAFSRDTVVRHEVGHVTGLGHNTSGISDLMFAQSGFATATGAQNAALVANVYSIAR
ncbi:hypothetical protein CKY47_22070 [Saccharothrix yanglingensis]|uniref:Peptidase M10 metallopeptidase domain-containing protein n=2 Tax=Saccharothrix yanglingensis TaxID=659496 RepID=A0ABU0X5W0_9PSEU|nr:hypothetical protein [Saccharothrix yanglingensis]